MTDDPLETPVDTTAPAQTDPYAVLAREHRLIERGLDALGCLASQAARSQRLDSEAAALALRFLREFADRVHHLKEENLLFPAIAAKGYFPGCGLSSEHEEGRERVGRIAAAMDAAAAGNPESVRAFVRAARSFISFLRAHIEKEDDCLADVVHSSFSRQEGEQLRRQLLAADADDDTPAYERYLALVRQLETSCR